MLGGLGWFCAAFVINFRFVRQSVNKLKQGPLRRLAFRHNCCPSDSKEVARGCETYDPRHPFLKAKGRAPMQAARKKPWRFISLLLLQLPLLRTPSKQHFINRCLRLATEVSFPWENTAGLCVPFMGGVVLFALLLRICLIVQSSKLQRFIKHLDLACTLAQTPQRIRLVPKNKELCFCCKTCFVQTAPPNETQASEITKDLLTSEQTFHSTASQTTRII